MDIDGEMVRAQGWFRVFDEINYIITDDKI